MSVTDTERRAAAFVAEYEALCREHGCMVIMVADDEGHVWDADDHEYTAFAVGCFNEPEHLDQALEEMRIEPPRWIEQEDDA